MNLTEVKELVRQELPYVLKTDKTFRYVVQDMLRESFADKQKTENRIEQMLKELKESRVEIRAMREESQKRWDKQYAENRDLREESQQILKEMQLFTRKYDSNIGALGARWGLHSEQSFRNALKSILEESFSVKVLNITEYDDEGEVFGRPDQVELDIIVKNGLLILCEIKSSISKSDMYIFGRKVRFYEKHHNTKATRQIVISPMIDKYAYPVAEKLGIETYSHAEEVT